MTIANLGGLDLNGAPIGTSRELPRVHSSGSVDPVATATQPGEVNITSTATLLSRLGKSLSGQPAVDDARVKRLSQAIGDGTYSVRSDKVAAGLVQYERSLLSLPLAEI